MSPKTFEMSSSEFVSAICRRNTVKDVAIPKYTALISRENPHLYYCVCDGGARPKAIDSFVKNRYVRFYEQDHNSNFEIFQRS